MPAREEQTEALLALIPAERNETFALIDICAGEGLLCERVLETYPNSRVLALDGSELMRARARARLPPFAARAEVRAFELDGDDWTEHLPSPLRCAISSMALHHLEAHCKRHLFRRLADPFERAVAGGWHPTWDTEAEAGEMPYRVFDQLKWLEEAGFSVVDCFWMRAGHAIYGGYN